MDEKLEKKEKRSAFDAAADYLSRRARTCKETRDYLRKKEYSEEEISEAVNKLLEYEYLDDADYAKRYFEYGYSRMKGRRKIEAELMEKGVEASVIANACEDYFYENGAREYENALEIAQAEYERSGKNEADEKLVGKVARKLESKGYRTDDIYKVIAEMRRWKDSDEV
ncbi:MAG: regulatory protein RecX [Mogibacterium sp.]|nr:regulatory protein RecX [Mogibacterium sp.]